jgi:hypothetical protein
MFTEKFDDFACFGDSIACSVDGFDVSATIHEDHFDGPPWEEGDGHGPVSEWTNRAKGPGERVLSEDGAHRRYYDVAEATEMAKRDGWDTPPYGEGTKGERAARAVEADFLSLRGWCQDEWHYCLISLSVSRGDVELLCHGPACCRIELNYPGSDNVYLSEVANELLPEALEEARKILADLVSGA